MKKKHGWILQEKFLSKGDCRFYCFVGGYFHKISKAQVFNKRQTARLMKLDHETIHKVVLTKEGKAKKIIPGR